MSAETNSNASADSSAIMNASDLMKQMAEKANENKVVTRKKVPRQKTVLFSKSTETITNEYAYEVLTLKAKNNISFKTPHQPVGSHLYLFDTYNMEMGTWRQDGYNWTLQCHHRCSKIPLGKMIYAVNSRRNINLRFTRVMYYLHQDDRFVLVHYVGDESLFIDPKVKEDNLPEDEWQDDPQNGVAMCVDYVDELPDCGQVGLSYGFV